MNHFFYRSSVTAVALGLILIGSLAGTALAQEQKVDDRAVETPEQKRDRMFRAFDNSSSFRLGALIVNFTPGTTKEAARAVLARHNLAFETETACGPEEAGPEQERTKPTGKTICQTFERWIVSISAAVAKVPEGEERAYAERLIAEPEVVWVEPDLIATIAGEKPLVEDPPKTTQTARRLAPYLAIGVIVVLALAFFLRRKKPAA